MTATTRPADWPAIGASHILALDLFCAQRAAWFGDDELIATERWLFLKAHEKQAYIDDARVILELYRPSALQCESRRPNGDGSWNRPYGDHSHPAPASGPHVQQAGFDSGGAGFDSRPTLTNTERRPDNVIDFSPQPQLELALCIGCGRDVDPEFDPYCSSICAIDAQHDSKGA